MDPLSPVQSTLAAQTALTTASLVNSIGIANLAQGQTATDVLRTVLAPVYGNPALAERLSLSLDVRQDLGRFVEGNEEPPAPLLEALQGQVQELRAVVGEIHPEWLAGTSDSATTTGKIERRALQYTELSDEARARHAHQVHEAVTRMLEGIDERARTSLVATPKAISLKDVLEHPENYRNKPLEIVLFDVDGTTHKGETFFEGQYSVEWLLRDVLRYGPKATAGLSWWRLVKAIPGIISLRLQERSHKNNGGADRSLFAKTFAPLLKGLDGKLAQESLTRFYNRYGQRGVSEFMMTEFIRHRQKDRLIIGISASLEYIVKMHARDLGVPQENVLGTTIELDGNQRATGNFRWLHDEEKVRALEEFVLAPLREKGIQYKFVAGYSDSPSDQPMLNVVKEDGGVAYATNSSKEEFRRDVLADGGVAVDEDDGWFNRDGVRNLTFATSQTGQFIHLEKTPPKPRAWVGDLGNYAGRLLTDAAGFAVAAPVSQAVGQALSNGGHVDASWGLLSSMPGMATAGFFASALTTFLVPPDGPVSWQRRAAARGMVPVASAMMATGSTGGLGFWLTLLTAFVASAGVELLTAGERTVGLRRWRGGEERKNPVGRAFGFAGLRSMQVSAFRGLAYLLQRFVGA